MRIQRFSHIPLKYWKDIVDQYLQVWYADNPNNPSFLEIVEALYALTNKKTFGYNYVGIATDTDGTCVGHLIAHRSDKIKGFHPFSFVISLVCGLVLFVSGKGRASKIADDKATVCHKRQAELGAQILLHNYTYSTVVTGTSVVVKKSLQNKGIYKQMLFALFSSLPDNGCLVFQTSTLCTYKAHEAIGAKLLFEMPHLTLTGWSSTVKNSHTSYVMYIDKESVFSKI